MAGIMLAALPVYLWGIRRDLPIIYEIDEPPFTQAAAGMAAAGTLNPGWFGHPGSTVIYPLAVMYHAFDLLDHNAFMTDTGEFYLLGRMLMVVYAVLSLPLVLQVGRSAFGTRPGLIAAWLTLLSPLAVEQFQQTRTDAPALFFTLLTLWLCLRLWQDFTTRRALLAGAAVGLAVSTKYSLAALALLLLAVDAGVWWRCRCAAGPAQDRTPARQIPWAGIVAGVLAIPLSFMLTTPYFFLDHATAMENIHTEARSTHPGADGLAPSENFRWYVANVIPDSLGLPNTILAAAGVGVALWRRRAPQLLLLGFTVAYLSEVSLHPLHWARWIIPILPVCFLFATEALSLVAAALSARLRWGTVVEAAVLVVAVCGLSYTPARAVIRADILHANPSTRIVAREWTLRNLPPGTAIAEEWFTAPLNETTFDVGMQFSLATDHTLEEYRGSKYHYLMVSSSVYETYIGQPSRYPNEVGFYQQLFAEGKLVQEFASSATRAGPTVRLYELQPPAS